MNFDIESILYSIPAVVIGFTIHEYAHAYTAYRLGDNTAKDQGRLTFNPVKHIDPFGMLFIVLAGFGWARPVQFSAENSRNPNRDEILIAAAGPMSNLLLGLLAVMAIKLFVFITGGAEAFGMESPLLEISGKLLLYFMYINFALFIFNLIPIPPLDGSHIVFRGFNVSKQIESIVTRVGGIALFAALVLESVLHVTILPMGWAIDQIVGVFF